MNQIYIILIETKNKKYFDNIEFQNKYWEEF